MSTTAYPLVEAPGCDPDVPTDPIFRLSVEQYHEMTRSGILTPEDRVELLEGWLVPKMSKNPPHSVVNELVAEALRVVVPRGWFVRMQEPLTTSTSEPEPDVSVARGQPRDYLNRHPGPQDLAMIVEISDTSVRRDRGIKRRAYARAGVAIYWIVDLIARRVEICTQPSGPAEQPAYGSVQPYTEDEMLPVIIDGLEVGRIAVREILP